MRAQISFQNTGAWGWDGKGDSTELQFYQGASAEIRVMSSLARVLGLYEERPQEVVAPLYRTPGEWECLQEDFQEIETRCAKENWDGEGASKVSKKTIRQAKKFLEFFPGHLPLPEIAPEPDGYVNLEWFVSHDFLFEISVDGGGSLFYAGRIFGSRFHGKEKLGKRIPSKILEFLKPFQTAKLSE